MMFYLSKSPYHSLVKNLGKVAYFGYYYRRFNVLVDRASLRNLMAFEQAGQKIKEGQNMVIFPEGGIINTTERLAKFKNGSFVWPLNKMFPLFQLPLQTTNVFFQKVT